jgi:hypothetical protein
MRSFIFAALALLASCAPSRLQTQQANPAYVGKPFKSIMVVAVTADELVRRPFEDRMVAMLGKRGVKGIQGYSQIASRGKVQEAELRQAIAQSGAEGVLITRAVRVDRNSTTIPGASAVAGIGWVGFYGYYDGVWSTVTTPSQQITGPTWTLSETRLFDAKDGALAWSGVMNTRESDDLNAALTQYIEVIFDAMVNDRVL